MTVYLAQAGDYNTPTAPVVVLGIYTSRADAETCINRAAADYPDIHFDRWVEERELDFNYEG